MQPSSKQELIDYCLRRLGGGAIDINVTPDQLDDRFDEALQFYQEHHSDAVQKTYFKHQLTQSDLDDGYITVPEPLLYITRIFNTKRSMGSDMFNVEYQMYMNDLAGLRGGAMGDGLISWEMSRQYMATVDLLMTGMSTRLSWNRHKNQIMLDEDVAEDVTVGQWIVVEGYTALDPLLYTDVYNDMALKEHLVILIKQQWGSNLSKFSGMQLPGGVTIDGKEIASEAKEELREFKETYRDKYSAPDDFFIG